MLLVLPFLSQATTYYNKTNSDLTNVASWGQNANGTGTSPANFTTDGDIFNLDNNPGPQSGGAWTVGSSSAAGAAVILNIDYTGGSVVLNGDLIVAGKNSHVSLLSISAGATLDLGTNLLTDVTAGSLSNNNYTNNGTLVTANTSASAIPSGFTWGGTVVYDNTTTNQTIVAGTYNNLTLGGASGTVTYSPATNLVVNGILTTVLSTTTLNMDTKLLSGMSSVVNNGIVTTKNITAAPIPAGLNWSGGTVTYNNTTANQTIVAGTYGNLSVGGGSGSRTATLGGGITVNGDLTINATSTLSTSASNYQINIEGSWVNNGTAFTANSSTVFFDGTTAQSIGGSTVTSFKSITISNIGAAVSVNTNINVSSTLNMSGTGTILTPAAAVVINSAAATGTITGSGTLQVTRVAVTADYVSQYKFLTNTLTSMTVDYTGAGAQTVNNTVGNYGALKTSTSGTKSLQGAVTVNGSVTIGTGSTLDVTASNFGVTLAGDWSNNGTFNARAGTVTLNGTSSEIIGGSASTTFNNLTISNSAGTSLGVAESVNATLKLASGRLTIGNYNLVMGSSAAAIGGILSSSNMVVATGSGQLQKQFTANGSYTFPVGDNSPVYSPITLNVTGAAYAGAYVGVNVTNSKEIHNANTTNYLNRFWTVATSGITSPSYKLTGATYAAADVTGTEANMVLGQYSGSLPWVKVTGSSVNTGTHVIAATGAITATSVNLTGINVTNPTASASPSSSTISSGSSVGLSATGSGDAPLSYTWTPGTGLSASTGASVTASPSSGTVYTLTATDGNGFTATSTATVNVIVRYYSGSTGNLDNLTSWWANRNGTGSHPSNFTNSYQIFQVINNTSPTIGANWAVSGTGSDVIVGDSSTAINFSVPSSFSFTGPADVSNNAKLTMQNATTPTLGTLGTTSTVEYAGVASYVIPLVTFGNLIVSTSGSISFTAGTNNVMGDLTQTNGTLVLNTVAAPFSLNVYGNCSLSGGTFDFNTSTSSANNTYFNLYKNFTMTGSSSLSTTGVGALNGTLVFSGSGTSATPQIFTVSNGGIQTWVNMTVNAGTYVQLAGTSSSITMNGWSAGTPDWRGTLTVNGTLDTKTTGFIANGSNCVFNLAAGATLITANVNGMGGASNGAIGSAGWTNSISGSANFVYNGIAAQISGTYLPATIASGGTVTIDNGAGVTVSQTTTFSSGAALNLINGTLTNTSGNLAVNSGASVSSDNGHIAVAPTIYSGVSVTYTNLGNNAAAPTIGNEWPAIFTGTVVINKASSTLSLNNAKALTGLLTFMAGTLDATASNYNLSLTGDWTNNASATAFTPRSAKVTMNGTSAQLLGGSSATTFNNLVINNASGVTLNTATTFASGATLSLQNGTLNIGANLTMSSGSSLIRDNGLLSSTPSVYSGINLSYANLGNNALAVTADNEWPATFTGTVTINKPSATISLNGSKVVTGSVTLSAGTLDVTATNYNISLTGDWMNNSGAAAFTARSAAITFNGSSPQTVGGTTSTSFNDLTLNNGGGATLGNNETINGMLTLTSGNLNIAAKNLMLSAATPAVAGGPFSATKMIVADGGGEVRKSATSNAQASFTFPVGDNTGTAEYSPVTLTFSGGTYAGYSSVKVVNAKHPSNANSNDYLKRYWTVAQSGYSGFGLIVAGTYVSGDITGTQGNILMGKWDGALPWTRFAGSNTGFVLTSSSTSITSSSDFTGLSQANPTVSVSPLSPTVCPGASVGLTASGSGDPGLNYSWSPASGLSATTGSAVTATPTVTTTYSVTITDGNGLKAVNTTTVTINATPVVYSVGGGGSYCQNGTVPHVTLGGSTAGVNYLLYRSGTLVATIAGTGATLDMGARAPGYTFTVTGVNASTGCTNNMTGSTTVTMLPAPAMYTVTGGGAFCSGGAGVHVGLSTSDAGISYQLYNVTASGSPLSGTGASLDFGIQTAAGTAYYVVATNTVSGCTKATTSSVAVSLISLPWAFTVTGGGSVCSGGSGNAVGLSSTVTSMNYQLYRSPLGGGAPIVAVGSPVAGTGTIISFGIQSTVGMYTVVATNTVTGCVGNMSGSANITGGSSPTVYSVTGGGSYCSGGTGVHVGLSNSDPSATYQLYNGASAIGSSLRGTNAALDFGLQTSSGTYTVIATHLGNGCSSTMSGSVTITVNSVPAVYAVTGGGNYCAGGSGVHVGTSGSASGINYQLYMSGTASGSAVAGTGAAIDFGLQTTGGTYTVIATDATSGCSSNMSSSATVGTNALPLAYVMTGGGSYCSGGTGLMVYLSSTQYGVNYQLYNSGAAVGSPVAGTGVIRNFGIQTAGGTYSVVGTNATTGCSSNMSNTVGITVNALPTIYTVTGGGTYCQGSTAPSVGLTNSQSGVNYQLYTGTTTLGTTGSPVSGTGSAISFGAQTLTEVYSVIAADATTGCSSTMTGTTTVSMNAAPAVVTVTGGGDYCSGTGGAHIGLAGSCVGIDYQLYYGVTPVGSAMSGSGTSIDFGLKTATGTYSVVATNTVTACTSAMTGTPGVSVSTMPTISGSIYTVALSSTITLSASITGGTWSSDQTSIATVGSTGDVTGASYGATLISYTMPSGCIALQVVAVTITGFKANEQNAMSSELDVTIAPNPSHGTFTVKGKSGTTEGQVYLEVVNTAGQVVYKQNITAAKGDFEQQIQLENAANGMYLLSVRGNNSAKISRIVIDK